MAEAAVERGAPRPGGRTGSAPACVTGAPLCQRAREETRGRPASALGVTAGPAPASVPARSFGGDTVAQGPVAAVMAAGRRGRERLELDEHGRVAGRSSGATAFAGEHRSGKCRGTLQNHCVASDRRLSRGALVAWAEPGRSRSPAPHDDEGSSSGDDIK